MKYLKFILISLVLSFLCSCSSSSSETNQTKSNSAANSSTANSAANLQMNSSSSVTTNGSVQVVANVDPNAFNAKPDTNVRVVAVDPKDDRNKSGVTGRTAPDNSTVSSSMNAKGIPIETRAFNNDKYLIKVERIFTNPKTIKIYLKNGKVVEVGEDKLPNFTATSTGNILIAAGYDLNKIAEQNAATKDAGEKKQP
ncbi:MAG TPA: hypothetical protein PKY59_11555 [Pyrinomonadaceae bacterium]|nr:hypothetical protein [Pyrinomonadaceae bacterium]